MRGAGGSQNGIRKALALNSSVDSRRLGEESHGCL